MKQSKALEDYLESILVFKTKKGRCKAIDISYDLNVSRPAVTKEINLLINSGYVYKEGTSIELTEKGYLIAKNTYDKHLLIKSFLLQIGVDEKNANIDCCKIEHCISNETFEAIKKQIK